MNQIPQDIKILVELADKAKNCKLLMASDVERYKQKYSLEDDELVYFLKLPNIHYLYILCLSYKPSPQDIYTIANYLRCNPDRLLRFINNLPINFDWKLEDNIWVCILDQYKLVVISNNNSYTAYVSANSKKNWSPRFFTSLDEAKNWCEVYLDNLLFKESSNSESFDGIL